MEVYFQLIRDAAALEAACAELRSEPALGFDTETTELDPYKGELRLVQLSSRKNTYVFDLRTLAGNQDLRNAETLRPLRSLLASPAPRKVAHNAKFDAKWVRFRMGVEVGGIFDTYLASQLIAAGDSDRRHGLADVVQYFTGVEMDKSEQLSNWAAAELSASQIEYAARDAAVMLGLYDQIRERLGNDRLERVAELENECVMPIAEMELNGVYLDSARWREQLERVRVAQSRVADELQEMLSAGVAQASLFGRADINLDSQVQVSEALTGLGVPMPETTRAWQLQPLAAQYPVVAKLLEYRGVAKSLSSFGENILEFIEPTTGRVHADFRQIGAPTGRFSCSNPNLQQIPHDPEYRRCFRAPEGRKLVIADYSQIELRILADFSEDRKFIDAFVSGADFHAATAALVFGCKTDEVSAEQRSFAKRLNFGMVYGVGASRFAMMTGLSQTEAENIMRRYFGTFSGLDAYLREAGRRVIVDRVARTRSDRLLKLRFDDNDRQELASAKRYGVNMPIQGTSADILKRALRLLHDSITGTSAKLINIVHDEIVVECEAAEADETGEKLGRAMSKAGQEFVSRVPIKVDVTTSDEWAK
jgi:DNA polymerase-1